MSRYGIDIFSGAGGLSLGAEMAGIKIKTAIEINKSAAHTFLRNHTGADVLQDDIQDIDPKKLHSEKKPIFVIMGGPPCQGFSLSNTRTRNMKNEKNYLFLEFVRFVQEIKPAWFVLENVWAALLLISMAVLIFIPAISAPRLRPPAPEKMSIPYLDIN